VVEYAVLHELFVMDNGKIVSAGRIPGTHAAQFSRILAASDLKAGYIII
jgi:hypothetical protein